MEKKNTGLVVLVVILSLLVLGLGGHIVYDKVLNNKVKDTVTENVGDVANDNENNEVKENNENIDNSTILTDFQKINTITEKLKGIWTNCEYNKEEKQFSGIKLIFSNESPYSITIENINGSGNKYFVLNIKELAANKYEFNLVAPSDYYGSISTTQADYKSLIIDMNKNNLNVIYNDKDFTFAGIDENSYQNYLNSIKN